MAPTSSDLGVLRRNLEAAVLVALITQSSVRRRDPDAMKAVDSATVICGSLIGLIDKIEGRKTENAEWLDKMLESIFKQFSVDRVKTNVIAQRVLEELEAMRQAETAGGD